MTTPEKSVEEIVEEFKSLTVLDVNLGGWNIPYEGTLNYKQYEWLTQTLQTERQKREEVVEAERERLLTLFSHQEYIKRNALVDALTQPNNSK